MTPEQEIRRRISSGGPITLAEFIEVALYWPQGGFYAGHDPVGGPNNDFYTSPLVHPAFGALLAVQLFQMWQIMEHPDPFTVIEPGAGNGLLARDIVNFAQVLPGGFAECLQHICIDQRVLQGVESDVVNTHRVASAGLPVRPVQGCVLSNEFLDAFPVHQIVAQQGCLKEVYVAVENGELVTQTGEASTPDLAARFESLGVTLQEGQIAEVNQRLDTWAEEAAAALERGFVLTIDYGRVAEELYSAEDRFRGTLTTYHQHLQTDTPLKRIGQQDITAQVDFTSVVKTGRDAGLVPLGFATQRGFLHHLNLSHFIGQLEGRRGHHRELQASRAGMMELVMPTGFGDFKVLAQGKSVGRPNLWGFEDAPTAHELIAGFQVPALTSNHLNLIRERYPSPELDFEPFWPPEEKQETGR